MSKETFSEKISNLMFDKIKNLEYLDTDNFFYNDDYFKISLCLAYMTLSKEKIIKKDIKENDRLGRLTQLVDDKEIDKLFDTNFCSKVPIINYAREQNNLWILDNIRDSIMHGVFEIDEENRYFIINNVQANRELDAIIPFEWFISYAKSDILSQKELNNYIVRGFYYNKDKENRKNLDVRKEVLNNILYNIKISGDKFNINQVEKRIRELFVEYKDLEYDDILIRNKYDDVIKKYSKSYNEKYLVSFLAVSDKVKEKLEEEFSGIFVKVRIEHKKYRLLNKVEKRLPEFIRNYDLLIDEFNNIICSKGDNLLNCLSRIIDNIDIFTESDVSKFNTVESKFRFNIILNGDSAKYSKYNDINLVFKENMRNLRSICLNVYGLSTLVINHENLYNNYFLNRQPSDFNIFACSRQRYLDYSSKQKKLIMDMLDVEILLFSKNEQLVNCMVEEKKEIIKNKITDLNEEKKNLESELFNLSNIMKFEPIVKKDMIDYLTFEKLHSGLDNMYKHFYNATKIKDKKKIRKLIGLLIDKIIEEESKYTYGYCDDMEEVLTIIRNSFSHIGRISVVDNKDWEPIIILNDYDNEGIKTGEVRANYFDLINILGNPYLDNNKKKL